MNNDLILADAQGTPAGYGDTVQYILDKLGEGQLGPELVTNGGFDTDTDWTKGAGWAISAGAAVATSTASALYQAGLSLVIGGLYEVTFTVTVDSGSLYAVCGSRQGPTVSASGTYTQYLSPSTTSGQLEFWGSSFSGTLDNISVRELKGNHAHQTSASLKPVRGRVPVGGKRNLLVNTSVSAWLTPIGLSAAASIVMDEPVWAELPVFTVTAPAGETQVGLRQRAYTNLGDRHLLRLYVENVSGVTSVRVHSENGAVAYGSMVTLIFDINTGAVSYVHPDVISHSVTSYQSGWLVEVVAAEAGGNGQFNFEVFSLADSAAGCAFKVGLVQFEPGDTATPYQRVTSDLDVYEEGQQHIEYLRLDHTDDKLLQTFPNGLNGDLVVCGTKGSWVDRGVSVAAGGDLVIGPTGLPNTPGVLPALGDIIGWVPVNKTLTEEEWRRVVDYYKGRGAKGQLVPSGTELVTNGTFDADVSGWLLYGDGSIVWDSGRLVVTRGANTTGARPIQSLSIEAGKTYLLKAALAAESTVDGEVMAVAAGLALRLSPGDVIERHIQASSLGRIDLQVYGAAQGSTNIWDNISLQELIPEEDLA